MIYSYFSDIVVFHIRHNYLSVIGTGGVLLGIILINIEKYYEMKSKAKHFDKEIINGDDIEKKSLISEEDGQHLIEL